MLNPSHPLTARLSALLMIPLLLSMGFFGRTCSCLHGEGLAGSDCMEAMGQHEGARCDDGCTDEDSCGGDHDCCCRAKAPVAQLQLAEANSTSNETDFLLQAAVFLAVPASGAPAIPEAHFFVTDELAKSSVPWPGRPPLFVLHESYLC